MHFSLRKKAIVGAAILFFGLIWPASARADVTEMQPLRFGEWAVTNNTGSRFITVQTNGGYSNSPELIMISPPQPGTYRVTGLPSLAVINSVDVTMIDPLTGGNQIFTMDDFQVIAPNADINGETVITLGATARTTGNGVGYDDAVYNGTLQLDINL